MTSKHLKNEFDTVMMTIYSRALSEAKYRASRFFEMLHDIGGLETAKTLIHSPKVSEGYTALWERGRLDLTVEATILMGLKWHPLFTSEELDICQKRLEAYQFDFQGKNKKLV